jgi:hypothetical protein
MQTDTMTAHAEDSFYQQSTLVDVKMHKPDHPNPRAQ